MRIAGACILVILAAAVGASPGEEPAVETLKRILAPPAPRPAPPATEAFAARLERGVALLREGKKEEAAKVLDELGDELRRYVHAAPNDAKAWQLLGLARMYQSYDFPARQAFERAIALEPRNADHRILLGRLYRYNKRWDEAAEQFQKAIALVPGDAEAWTQLGEVQAEQARYDEALASLRKAVALRADNTRAMMRAGVILASLGRSDEAMAMFAAAIKANPKDSGAHFNLGRMLQDGGRAEEARAMFREAVRLSPADWQAWSHVVQTSEALGDRAARDEARAKVLDLRARGAVAGPSFCRDRFAAAGRKVLAFEVFQGTGSDGVRYRFRVSEEAGGGAAWEIRLGREEKPPAAVPGPGAAGEGERPFRLDASDAAGRRWTYAVFKAEPTYEGTKQQVIGILEGRVKAAPAPDGQ